MNKGRGAMPRLNLRPKYHFDLSIVFAPRREQRLENAIDREGKFGANQIIEDGLSEDEPRY